MCDNQSKVVVSSAATPGRWHYDAERRLTQTSNALSKFARTSYDLDGRPIRSAAELGTQWLESYTRYSPTGKATRAWGPALTVADTTCPSEAAPVPITDIAYDDQDRVLRTTQALAAADGGNRVTDTAYFADGRVKTVASAVGTALAQTSINTTYTANGQPQTLTDARGSVSRYEYDAFDRRIKLFHPLPATPGTASTTDYEQYGYDANGNLTTLRRRSNLTVTLTTISNRWAWWGRRIWRQRKQFAGRKRGADKSRAV